ncbi:MAG: hypothetical protein NTZ49_01015 [Candidatus Parcubacteria bacterium]|nr:hypothetical protein [Candidatus Parcubacteria bacterium]
MFKFIEAIRPKKQKVEVEKKSYKITTLNNTYVLETNPSGMLLINMRGQKYPVFFANRQEHPKQYAYMEPGHRGGYELSKTPKIGWFAIWDVSNDKFGHTSKIQEIKELS